ncbi:Uncharacterized protein PBTT_00561 [Plasmodiophora brassicae]|uniref:Uncharacterized protein n=1 Tax=Plasmodiophora brassicae TaxID=37360 RepID=A0A0G4J1C5_PLABS|nr:hypothetical protein PBRA_002048 [Plasmodiophora brassicae]SPQ93271.1 unnamed protein product [Plasmodiophora brassicae]
MPDGILISEEEFARVVSLKAAHDTGAERQRELAERNRALARSLDECRAEAARFEAQLQALRDDVDKAGRRARTAEELAASLQADLLAKESEVALLESNVTSLTAKLHGAEEAILQHKVQEADGIGHRQQHQRAARMVAQLEQQLMRKQEEASVSERKLAEMQEALHRLEAVVQQYTDDRERYEHDLKTLESTSTSSNAVIPFNPSTFLETCTKADLLVKIDELKSAKRRFAIRVYSQLLVLFTFLILFALVVPLDI